MNAKWLAKEYILSVHAWLLDRLSDPILAANKIFCDQHKGERCFILGSGPSIKEQDLTRLSGELVMTQNHFHAHDDIKTINPSYHVNVPMYQPAEYHDDWRQWLTGMNERLPTSTTLFFGKNTKCMVDELGLFQGRSYYIKTGGSFVTRRTAPVDLTRTIMPVPTVLTQCLAIAIYMGFSEIVLTGFDLDQIFLKMQDRSKVRFYGLSPITDNEAEETAEKEAAQYGKEWFYWWMIWQQCFLLKDVAEKKGIRVVNATRGGLLNVFPRKIFEDMV
ncbi:MAG: hypothetical protein C0623_00735 [Desulfuromonas sp.]|nr:MAG: hypothetical protein C0623_00735 [Desulfuromonas sp.]